MNSPALFLLALAVGWIRFRLIRSATFWRMLRWSRQAFLVVRAFVWALEAVLFTKSGRLRRRRDIMSDAMGSLGMYVIAMELVERWKIGRRP